MAETKPLSPSGVLRFGVFEVNLPARELRKHGVRVRLPGQPFCILSMLLEKPGEIVTREEMQQRLWASDTFVDFEHSLNSAIKKLRAALGDSPENSRYIETVPRLGYRFVAPLEQVSVPALAEGAGAGHEPGRPAPKRTRWAVPAGLAAIVILGLAAYWQWGQIKAARQREGERRMLAVLPFENLTGDLNQDYLTDGLTEEMIAQLGRLDPKHLGVIARTSVMHYKHSQDSLQQVGRDLGVQYVLEGSFRRDAGQVRISAQLIQLKDQTYLWSRQYERQLSGLLPLQGEIAQEIADEIQLTLGSPKRGAGRASAPASQASYEAYDLYLRGRYFWNKRTEEGFKQAASYFERSIATDSSYARLCRSGRHFCTHEHLEPGSGE